MDLSWMENSIVQAALDLPEVTFLEIDDIENLNGKFLSHRNQHK